MTYFIAIQVFIFMYCSCLLGICFINFVYIFSATIQFLCLLSRSICYAAFLLNILPFERLLCRLRYPCCSSLNHHLVLQGHQCPKIIELLSFAEKIIKCNPNLQVQVFIENSGSLDVSYRLLGFILFAN